MAHFRSDRQHRAQGLLGVVPWLIIKRDTWDVQSSFFPPPQEANWSVFFSIANFYICTDGELLRRN